MKKEIFYIFDQYLSGEMPEVERINFEQQLKSSADLRNQFLDFKSSVDALLEFPDHIKAVNSSKKLKAEQQVKYLEFFDSQETTRLSLEDKLTFKQQLDENEWLAFQYKKYKQTNGISKDNKSASKSSRLFALQPALRYIVAASVTLILGLAGARYFYASGIDTDTLYVQYNIPELYPKAELALVNEGLVHRGIIDSNEFSHLKSSGLQAYEEKDWDNTIRLLSEYISKAKPNEEDSPDEINFVQLYIGRAWLEKGEFTKSIEVFQAADAGIIDTVNYGLLRELIRWQLSLAYLKNDDLESTRIILEELVNAQHPTIREQAIHLLNDIK